MSVESKMAVPQQKEYPPDNLWEADNLVENTAMFHVTATNVRISLYQETTARILSLPNGTRSETATTPPSQLQYEIPFVVALIKDGMFLFGEEAVQAEGKGITKWNLGKLLVAGDTTENPPVIKHSEGAVCKLTVDMLLSMYFRHMLHLIITKEWDPRQGGKISLTPDVIFCVPLWFPTLPRVRIRNAAAVNGISNPHIVNDCTLTAYVSHCAALRESEGDAKRQIFVFSESSGNVDLALYVTSGDMMEMVSCSGNAYLFSDSQVQDENHMNLDLAAARNHFKTQYNANRESEPCRKALIRGLIRQVLERTPEHAMEKGLKPNVILTGEDATWRKVFVEECAAHFVSVSTPLIHSDGAVKSGAVFWEPLNYSPILGKLLSGNYVTDLNPYELFGKHFLGQNLFLENKLAANQNQRNLTLEHPTSKVSLYEKYSTGEQLPLGSVTVSRLSCYLYSKLTVNMKWSPVESAYQLEAVFGCNSTGESNKLLECPEEYQWHGEILSEQEIEKAWSNCEVAWDYMLEHQRKVSALMRKCHKVKLKLKETWGKMEEKRKVMLLRLKIQNFESSVKQEYYTLDLNLIDEIQEDLTDDLEYLSRLK